MWRACVITGLAVMLVSVAVADPLSSGGFSSDPYNRIIDGSGTSLPRRPKLKCGTNVSCVDDPVNGWTEISAVGGGGGGGDVFGPASSSDNEVVRFSGVTGKVIQDGTGCLLGDDGKFTGTCGPRSLVGVSSCMLLTASQTVFMAPGSCADQVEASVTQPVHSAVTLDRLACRTSVAIGVGNTITVTLRKGACGGLGDGSSVCTLTGGASPSTCTSGASDTLSAGQCHNLRVVTSGTLAANPFVNCSLDRLG